MRRGCAGSVQEAAAAATALLSEGFSAIKIKVARPGSTPARDAEACVAVRRAVGPSVAIRADANRGYTLAQAIEFGLAACEASFEYVEEPVSSPHDLEEFHRATGVPVALDETVDESLGRGSGPFLLGSQRLLVAPVVGDGVTYIPPASAADAVQAKAEEENGTSAAGGGVQRSRIRDLPAGLAALVVKPSRVGAIEGTAMLIQWAARRGISVVLSSSFESSVGVSAVAALAQLSDAASGGSAPVAHGLGTLGWFAEDTVAPPLAIAGSAGAALAGGHRVDMASAGRILAAQEVRSAAVPPRRPLSQRFLGHVYSSADCVSAVAAFSLTTSALAGSLLSPRHRRSVLSLLHLRKPSLNARSPSTLSVSTPGGPPTLSGLCTSLRLGPQRALALLRMRRHRRRRFSSMALWARRRTGSRWRRRLRRPSGAFSR